jgi:glyoxylase-like metal-dependent hydrolase (beta-lactamase superfamily II)
MPPDRVQVQTIGEGLWFLSGSSHNSVAVEFRDFAAIIEAPLDEERSTLVLSEVRKLAPGKAIRYLVNTHHHFDHCGGLRTYVAQGATIITHQSNRPFYETVLAAERRLLPDRLSLSPVPPKILTVDDKYVLTNGGRVLEIHHLQGNLHSDGLLAVYLPGERLLIEADAYTPSPADASPPTTPTPFALNLYENIQRLKLDVERIVPIHGRIVSWSELRKDVGKEVPPPPAGLLRARSRKEPRRKLPAHVEAALPMGIH